MRTLAMLMVAALLLTPGCALRTQTDVTTGPAVKDGAHTPAEPAKRVNWVKVGTATMDGLFLEFIEDTQDNSMEVSEMVDVVFCGVEYGAKAGDGWEAPFGKTTVKQFVKSLRGAIDLGLVFLGDYELFNPDTPHAVLAVAITNAFGLKYIEAIEDAKVTVGELVDAILAPISTALKETGKWVNEVPTAVGGKTTVGAIWEGVVAGAKAIASPFCAMDYVLFTIDDPAAAIEAIKASLRTAPALPSP